MRQAHDPCCVAPKKGYLALLIALVLGFSSEAGLAQRRQFAPAQPPAAPRIPVISETSPFGIALSSCDKAQEDNAEFALPGLKGEIKLDRCYRGRQHLACRFDKIMAEGNSMIEGFTRIVDEKYPDVGNVEGICKIDLDKLVKDFEGTVEFGKLFTAVRTEYDARVGCANKVKQSIRDVTLPDLLQAPEVLKSMIDAIEQDVNKVTAVQEQVAGLSTRIEVSQKSLAVLQKLHRAICFSSKAQPASVVSPAVN